MRYDYDLLGNRIHQASMEAGERWMLNDVTGKPIRVWDSRGHNFTTQYDPLRRPLSQFVRGTHADRSDPRTLNQDVLFDKTEYGEGQTDDVALNLRTRVFKRFDGAGVVTSMGRNLVTNQDEAYDFKGTLLRSSRRLLRDYQALADWQQNPALEQETFPSSTTYDALNRPTAITAPDRSIYRPTYNEANLLDKVDVSLRGAAAATSFVTNIDYDAKGQRTRINYGNGTRTDYEYDKETFRLIHLNTLRGGTALQDLRYTYDPVGNITSIRDDAQQTVYFNNAVAEPHCDYTYDAIYRLLEAKGREHIGQLAQPETTWNDEFRVNLLHPQDGQAMRNYTEQYEYDAVGNFEKLIHQAANSNWTRGYGYNEASLIEPATKKSNRLSSTTVGQTTETYTHDAHGNMTQMPHLSQMDWNFEDQLQRVDLGGGGKAYYVYDAAGQRARKVWEKSPGLIEERIYLGGFEIFRRRNGAGTITLERETLHIMDDKRRVALVETRTQGVDGSPAQLIRYQFGNHLGSASLELDGAGQIISYEEYYSYGSTAYQAVRSQTEVPLKRYRYTGKERDEETGLYYYGARYYAPWLGRWTSCDPAGMVDGPNRYVYVRNNPVGQKDPEGEKANPWTSVETEDPSAQYLQHFETGHVIRKSSAGVEVWEPTDTGYRAIRQEYTFSEDTITARDPTSRMTHPAGPIAGPPAELQRELERYKDIPDAPEDDSAGLPAEATEESEESIKDSPVLQFLAGAAVGGLQGWIPFGFVGNAVNMPTKHTEFGRGVGEAAMGVAQIIGGIGAIIGGGGAAAGGLVAAPVTGGASVLATLAGAGAVAAGWALIAQGVTNVVAGAHSMSSSTGGSAGGNGGKGGRRGPPADELYEGEGLNPDRSVRRVGGKQGLARGRESLRAANEPIERVYKELQLTREEQAQLHNAVHESNLEYEGILEEALRLWPHYAPRVGK